MHRTQDKHLERLEEGRVETITQNGEAAMVVMSPATYDAMAIELERGHLWDQTIARFDAGERGMEAREAIDQVAARLQRKL